MALSDAVFVFLLADHAYASGSVIDIGWVAGLLLLATAAVIGSGVENAATAARLATFGCDIIQGNYCSLPVSAAEVLGLQPLPPPADIATLSSAAAFDDR